MRYFVVQLNYTTSRENALDYAKHPILNNVEINI